MCDLYPVFRSCCGISVRIALLYIAVLSIVTGAVINGALKKVGLDVATIETRQDADESHKSLRMYAHKKYQAEGSGGSDDPGGNNPNNNNTKGDDNKKKDDNEGETSGSGSDYYDDDETTAKPVTTTPATTTTERGEFMKQMGSVNRNGLNVLASGFLCLGVVLLLANFIRSPELALVSVALTVTVAVSSLVLLAGVVGECAQSKDHCLLRKLDWFTSFCVTIFWFMYVFCWLFFAGVANAFANGFY